MREVEGEERKHASFSITGMLPLVEETIIFSQDGVNSMKKSGKTRRFFSKALQLDKLATCWLTGVLNAVFFNTKNDI